MNKKYKEVRTVDMENLRSLCISNNWYTSGNNKQYSALLNMCETENLTTENIVEMAEDIYAHSQLDNDHSAKEHIENICFEIARISLTFFEEKEEKVSERDSKQILNELREIKETMLGAELVKGQYMLWGLIKKLEDKIEE